MTAPFLNFKTTCSINRAKSNRIGIKAGYIKKLALTWPFISKTKLRCIPQPGQSICVICLNRQGSWCASSQEVIFNRKKFIAVFVR